MISFFLLSLPIFAVIGVGWAATRTRLVAQGALDALNAFSFRFALPALLLRLIAGQPLRQSFNPEFYTGYLASGAIIFVLVLGTSRVVGGGRKVPRGDDARRAENQHKDDRARCEVAGVELGIKRLTKWLARDEAQKEGWESKAKREGV